MLKTVADASGEEPRAMPAIEPNLQATDYSSKNASLHMQWHRTPLIFYVLMVLVFIVFMILIVFPYTSDFEYYTANESFPSLMTVMLGIIVTHITMAVICFKLSTCEGMRSWSLLIFILFNVFTLLWFFNLVVRVWSYRTSGDVHRGHGTGYLILIIAVVLVAFYLSFTRLGTPLAVVVTAFYFILLMYWLV